MRPSFSRPGAAEWGRASALSSFHPYLMHLSNLAALGASCLLFGFSQPQQGDPFQLHEKGWRVACDDYATVRPSDEEIWKRLEPAEDATLSQALEVAVQYAKEEQGFELVKALSGELILTDKPYYKIELLTSKDDLVQRWDVRVGIHARGVKWWLIQNRFPGTPPPPKTEMQTLSTGIMWCDIHAGDGAIVEEDSNVKVHYVASLLNGKLVFDTYAHAFPQSFALKEAPIAGLTQGLLGARAGAKRKLIIPPHLAFGLQGVPKLIPPNSTVVYDIQVLEAEKPGEKE